MKAIIEVDVPDYQIGQEVSIYFKDTMMIKGIVQEPKTEQWKKLKETIVEIRDNNKFDHEDVTLMFKFLVRYMEVLEGETKY